MNIVTSALPSRMKAAVLTGAGQMRVDTLPLPEPAAGQVRVALEGCGVCASSLTPWAGAEWMKFPTEPGGPGHEGWGVIDAVGADVEDLFVGDRVAALSDHAYATHDIAEKNAVIRLPDQLAGQPFPGEPLGCSMTIFKRSLIRTGHTVAVVGIGFLGALLMQLAVSAGARVIAISPHQFSLALARRAGASETIPMHDHSRIIDEVKALTDGRFCDCVIEADGRQWPLDLAGELTKERGQLIVAGYHQGDAQQDNMRLWNQRGFDVINAHERDPAVCVQDVRDAVEAVQEGQLDPSSLYTHHFPLERLDEALDMTRDRPHGFLKALMMYL